MKKQIVIYDAVNAGADWSEDIAVRCIGEEGKITVEQATIIGQTGTKLTMNKGIAELMSRSFGNMIVTDLENDLSVFIGNYVHQGFKTGMFPHGSEIHVVTASDAVAAAVTMAVILAAEYIEAASNFTFVIDVVTLQDRTNKVCYSRPRVILGSMDEID